MGIRQIGSTANLNLRTSSGGTDCRISSLMRSSGAVTVLAAAPAIAPAAKRAASLGTNASAANGCLRSWPNAGAKSFPSLFFSAWEIHAKFDLLRLPPASDHNKGSHGPSSAKFFGSRPGISRHTSKLDRQQPPLKDGSCNLSAALTTTTTNFPVKAFDKRKRPQKLV
ncbi:ribulose bisphosphate carboxylase small chain [Striga asiatica]|uniref:Ribulose bisphosphate carboxylase small chain n=1 Tax=Striga asiatica TaxID=4170 RepID=A0A5A7RF44_STRAF|nr:ribulose bisphosphate carboxylase small chain [Striga asiatica]